MRLMFILQGIIGLWSQSIDFTNAFDQVDIPSGELVFIEITRDFKSELGQGDAILRLKKSLYGQSEYSYLWHEKM